MVDSATVRFILFTGLGIVTAALGWVARQKHWVDESKSRQIHRFVVIWTWSATYMFSLWHLDLEMQSLWLVGLQLLLMGGPMVAMFKFVRSFSQPSILVLIAGLSNVGFTLGAFLCYVLMTPSGKALGYGGVVSVAFTIGAICFGYPVGAFFRGEQQKEEHDRTEAIVHSPSPIVPAKESTVVTSTRQEVLPLLSEEQTSAQGAFGTEDGDTPDVAPFEAESTCSLIFSSFFSLNSIPLLFSALGLLLNCVGVPFPDVVNTWAILDIILSIMIAGSYFGIGLRLRLRKHAPFRLHALVFAIKFVFTPLVAATLVWLTTFTSHPPRLLAHRVFVFEAFMPCGIAVVIVANIFGLDAQLASTLWFWNTAAFLVLVLPVIILSPLAKHWLVWR